MNDKSFNSALLLAILLTLVAVIAQRYFPQKRLLVWPNTHINTYFYSSAQTDGKPAAFWLDYSQGLWRCVYPENDRSEYFACSFNALLETAPDKGINLADYSQLNFAVKYQGNARKLRIYLRNFDPPTPKSMTPTAPNFRR